MISNKFLYDDGEDDEVFTDEWAASGGITVKQLVQLERDFLNAIDWEVYINEDAFWKKLKLIEATLAEREGLKRGWFTYTELQNLLEFIDIYSLIQCVACFTAILVVTYTASVLTILSSMVIVSNIPSTCLESGSIITSLKQISMPLSETQTPTLTDENETESLSTLDQLQMDITYKSNNKSLAAVDVLKTSILLASIKVLPNSRSVCNQTDYVEDECKVGNFECISWDWWNNPVMQWVGECAEVLKNFEYSAYFQISFHHRYLETSALSSKKLYLEDQIHKATKVRIQDQMERSWHTEWTDTIKKGLSDRKPHYFQDVKS